MSRIIRRLDSITTEQTFIQLKVIDPLDVVAVGWLEDAFFGNQAFLRKPRRVVEKILAMITAKVTPKSSKERWRSFPDISAVSIDPRFDRTIIEANVLRLGLNLNSKAAGLASSQRFIRLSAGCP
ncbi:hypothetical protein A6X21_22885 [Planctopirus hydrillae]|uniref:Uncharacterized protein n=1 Tax=Planctopirus hydrillae TaxID=1841610 RepID=A0A1C3ECV3_9PLAN|nr:hypothetical protein A6X21_22885 [Planctopirus hydrillae]